MSDIQMEEELIEIIMQLSLSLSSEVELPNNPLFSSPTWSSTKVRLLYDILIPIPFKAAALPARECPREKEE